MQQVRHFLARKTVGIKLAMTEVSSLGHINEFYYKPIHHLCS